MSPRVAYGIYRARREFRRALGVVFGPDAILVVRLVRLMNPDTASEVSGHWLQRIGPYLHEHRRGRANLRAAFPEKTEAEIDAILLGVWNNVGRIAGEFAHLDRLWQGATLTGQSRVEFPPDTIERFIALRDDGKPALFFAAHFGNWEMPALAAAANGMPSAVLFRRPNVAQVDRMVNETRAVNMGTLVANTLDAPVRLARMLEDGIHVGMLVDQFYQRGVDVTFFGRTTKANPLIARLARLVDCPIHGVRAIRLPDHRFRIEVTDAVEPVRDTRGRVDVQATMQRITGVIEGWIREYPEQWLWLHNRWR